MEPKFLWDRLSIFRAKTLADLGFSATETALAIGACRNACNSRARRMKEFQFKAKSGGFNHRPEYVRKRTEEALAAIAHIDEAYLDSLGVPVLEAPKPKENDSPYPPKPAGPIAPMSAVVVDRRKAARPKQTHRGPLPTVFKTMPNPDKPITKKTLKELIKPHPINAEAVRLVDAKNSQCRFIVGDIQADDTMVCGRRVFTAGASYCEHHEKLSRSGRKMRVIPSAKISSFDRNIKPVAPTTETESSLVLRKS